ncbi:hypothetical protein [Ramlibacter algicola]|uniref:Uncharacterized protein n=1 Tax=Ramlibacter algicola TaxID=2795217 RepID=A0A934UQN5_9BURK|nr:hypothetical protein [Ramlibacter algicola]MBK0392006.1 hypothetical protein [Ramlibacter algicola]
MTLDTLLTIWRSADDRARYWEHELRILLEEQPDGAGPDLLHVARVLQMRQDEQQALHLVVGMIGRYLPRGWRRALDAVHHRASEPTQPLPQDA